MKIDSYSNQSFQGVFVKSNEAVKILRKADRAVKASDAIFIDINIPNGHKKPLWSVLSQYITKTQQNNNNHIIIDVLEKGKQLLTVKTLDSKGFVHKKWVVNPMPVTGKMNEILPPDTIVLGNKAADNTIYGRSAFFDVIDNAEAEADMLKMRELADSKEIQKSVRELPKSKRINKTKGKVNHVILKKTNKQHVQKPFLMLKDLLFNLGYCPKPKSIKPEPKNKPRIPRHMKKELKKSQSV